MSAITDTSGDKIPGLDVGVRLGEPRELTIRVACKAGEYLKATSSSAFAVSARLAGSLDVFEPIDGVGLELDPWANTDENFEVKIEATGAIGDEVEIYISAN